MAVIVILLMIVMEILEAWEIDKAAVVQREVMNERVMIDERSVMICMWRNRFGPPRGVIGRVREICFFSFD